MQLTHSFYGSGPETKLTLVVDYDTETKDVKIVSITADSQNSNAIDLTQIFTTCLPVSLHQIIHQVNWEELAKDDFFARLGIIFKP